MVVRVGLDSGGQLSTLPWSIVLLVLLLQFINCAALALSWTLVAFEAPQINGRMRHIERCAPELGPFELAKFCQFLPQFLHLVLADTLVSINVLIRQALEEFIAHVLGRWPPIRRLAQQPQQQAHFKFKNTKQIHDFRGQRNLGEGGTQLFGPLLVSQPLLVLVPCWRCWSWRTRTGATINRRRLAKDCLCK